MSRWSLPPTKHLSLHIKIILKSKINRCTSSSSQYNYFILHLILCSNALQNTWTMYSMTSTQKAKKIWSWKVNNTLHIVFHSFWIGQTHEPIHTTFVIAQRWHHSFSLQMLRDRGRLVFGSSLSPSMSKLHSSPAHGIRARRSSGLDETLVPSQIFQDP